MSEVNYLFVYSVVDEAGSLMANVLRQYIHFDKLRDNYWMSGNIGLLEVSEDIVYTDNLEKRYQVNPKTIIFISRHSSTAKIKTLSVHVSGNPVRSADFGGSPRSLAPSHPILMRSVLINLDSLATSRGLNKEYKVTMEVTHHGPTEITCPSCFVEIGSSIEEWRDERAAHVVVEAILEAIEKPSEGKVCIGFGGPHYAPTFTRKVLEDKYAVGHIFSKYVIDDIDAKIISEALRKTMNTKLALLDWKGMRGGTRQKIRSYLEDLRVSYEKI